MDKLCPRCRMPLAVASYEGVEVDTCPACGGEWLDAGELRQILDAREKEWAAADLQALKQATLKRGPLSAPRENLSCPICREEMESFNYGGGTGIILDRCNRCGGLWLDAGELEKVQMVIEAWEGSLAEDLQRHAGRLKRAAEHEEWLARQDAAGTQHPGANRFLYQILDL